jgi:transcriptional regulator with XRE-family HTH domain
MAKTPPKWRRAYFREWREHFGISAEDMAEAIGISPSYYSQIETAQRRYHQDTLERAGERMGIPSHYLTSRLPPKPDDANGYDADRVGDMWQTLEPRDRARVVHFLRTLKDS